jgi:hypothetical protein
MTHRILDQLYLRSACWCHLSGGGCWSYYPSGATEGQIPSPRAAADGVGGAIKKAAVRRCLRQPFSFRSLSLVPAPALLWLRVNHRPLAFGHMPAVPVGAPNQRLGIVAVQQLEPN